MIYSNTPTVDNDDWDMVSHQDLVHTPTSSQLSQYDPVFDYTLSGTVSEDGFSSLSSAPLTPDRPCGLGLYVPSLEIDECYTSGEQLWRAQESAFPHASPALETTDLPIVNPRYLSNDMAFDHQYPSTASAPGTPWDCLYPTGNGPSTVPSPACSNYSVVSYHSPMRSSFAQSDSAVGLGASPYIKIEPPIDDILLPPGQPSTVKQSPQSSPRHPCYPLAETVEQRVAMFLAPSAISQTKNVDCLTVRPMRIQASSSNDAQLGALSRRKKRKLTTAANARLSCQVCGKLFQRKFNYTKHMETHQPFRVQPFACEYHGCNQRFGRRTDLVRHENSLHLQVRNHVCSLCNAAFSRKDTLRRHVDEGCRLRFTVKHRSVKGPQR